MADMASARPKRLRFRSWHRGWKEHDLLFGSFADAHLPGFDEGQLDRFEALLGRDDPEIDDWLSGRLPVPPEFDTDVLAQLRAHKAKGLVD